MEIQQFISFVTVVEQNSFSKAANKLGYSKSSITIQIKNLEEELGVQLFDRVGKKISLTNDGLTYYNDVLEILDKINNAKEHIKHSKELRGVIKIGTIDSLATTKLPSILEKYTMQYPLVKIKVVNDSIQGLLDKINSNDIDLAYLYDKQIIDHTIETILLSQNKANFVASINHPLTNQKNISIEQILKEKLILTEERASYREALDYLLSKRQITLKPSFEVQNTEIILKLLDKNVGISYLPDYAIVEHPNIHRLDSEYEIEMVEQILYHQNKQISPVMQSMITLIQEENAR